MRRHPTDTKIQSVVAHWVVNDLRRALKEIEIDDLPFAPRAVGELVSLVDSKKITGKAAKTVFEALLAGEGNPLKIVQARGLEQLEDQGELERIVDGVLGAEESNVNEYRAGKTALFGFFVGQVMKASRGRADPKAVSELLRSRLDG